MIYEFYTEDGLESLEYSEYLNRPDLMKKFQDDRRLFLNLGLKLFSFSRKWLSEHPSQRAFVMSLQQKLEANPLRYYLPNCAGREAFDGPAHEFINDTTHVYTGFTAGNRYGKSTIAFIKALLAYGVIPCDPEWEVFKDHGVKYREWTGPKEIAICSINWNNITETIWPQIVRAWLPADELGEKLHWQPPKRMAFAAELKCGSILHFKCARQPQSAFESQALDGAVWDEQGIEANFDGMDFRMKTRRRYGTDEDGYEFLTAGFHIGAATPHKVDGRADTGGGTWFEALYNRSETKGLTSKFYKGNLIEDVPDWIYPEREKRSVEAALAEAEITNNKKQVRAIRSRLYGEFETTGGMVYDEWDDDVHVIDTFKPPSHWCAFRCMDHGRTNPTSCVWVAISPNNEYFAYREMLRPDKLISENVAAIVELSGNDLQYMGEQRTRSGMLTRNRETFGTDGEQYIYDVLDGRSFLSPDNNARFNTGELYRIAGLHKLRAAPRQTIEQTLPIIKELLRVDPERIHYATKRRGAPKFYIMRSCPLLIKHVKGYRNKEDKSRSGQVSEKPNAKDDHDLDAVRYGFLLAPRYSVSKPYKLTEGEKNETNRERKCWVPEDDPKPLGTTRRYDPITGY